jgi:hypothetical protein
MNNSSFESISLIAIRNFDENSKMHLNLANVKSALFWLPKSFRTKIISLSRIK